MPGNPDSLPEQVDAEQLVEAIRRRGWNRFVSFLTGMQSFYMTGSLEVPDPESPEQLAIFDHVENALRYWITQMPD
jgi:hypothetical protein